MALQHYCGVQLLPGLWMSISEPSWVARFDANLVKDGDFGMNKKKKEYLSFSRSPIK
jgi:hypothetical protein